MKYMMLISGTNDAWEEMTDSERGATMGRIGAWWGERMAAGEITEGHQLQDSSTATTVRLGASGNVTVTDGPFVEGKELIGGYAIISVLDLDAAIRLASSWPAPDALEIRPLVEREQG